MKLFIKDYKRSIIFSILCFVSFFSLNEIQIEGRRDLFFSISALLSFLFLLLLYLDHVTNVKKYNQKEIFSLERSYYFQHILNHYLVPITLYLFTLVFIYLNTNFPLKIIIFFIVSVSLLICLVNVRSYFLNKLMIEHSTHSIYDGMKLIVFFLTSNALLHLYFNSTINIFVLLLLISLLTAIGIGLIFIRNNLFTKEVSITVILSSIIIALCAFLALRVLNFTLVQANLIMLTLFYFIVAIIHHRIERTLTRKIILNYLMFCLIVIALMYGMR